MAMAAAHDDAVAELLLLTLSLRLWLPFVSAAASAIRTVRALVGVALADSAPGALNDACMTIEASLVLAVDASESDRS